KQSTSLAGFSGRGWPGCPGWPPGGRPLGGGLGGGGRCCGPSADGGREELREFWLRRACSWVTWACNWVTWAASAAIWASRATQPGQLGFGALMTPCFHITSRESYLHEPLLRDNAQKRSFGERNRRCRGPLQDRRPP